MNILITHESFNTNNITHDDWHHAVYYFSRPQLLHVMATLLVVQNSEVHGETYDNAIDETIEELIGKRANDQNEEHPAPVLTDLERCAVARYLKDSVKAMRPYMPDSGSLELITYVNEPETNRFFLVVRYHPDDEHSDKAFTRPSVRG